MDRERLVRVLGVCLVFFELVRIYDDNNIRRRRRFGIHPLNRARDEYGHYSTLVGELRRDEDKFINFTRLDLHQFALLNDLVSPHLRKNSIRRPISPECRLLITLRYLATGDNNTSIAYDFRVGKLTVSKIIKETTRVIWQVLSPIYLKPPSRDDLINISDRFYSKWNLPNVLGAIDGKHVIVIRPQHSGSTFFNYKKDNSIVLMASADGDLRFNYIDVGAQGSVPDSSVFKNSVFGDKIIKNTLQLPEPRDLPNTNHKFPFYFIGDEAFPLLPNLMRPYRRTANMTQSQKIFNYRLSRARMCVERAFGVLAGRFRVFYKPIHLDIKTADFVIKACVCLHNFIIETKGLVTVNEDGVEGNIMGAFEPLRNNRRDRNPTRIATQLRDNLCRYVNSESGSVPWQVNRAYRLEHPE